MLIIGTVIGAGFASGREIVAFFGPSPSPLVALACAVLVFVMCCVFLLVGRKAHADDIGEVNRKLFGRFDVVLNICLLFNSVVSLSAMLAGFDSLFGSIYPLKPLYSVLFAVISTLVVMKGLNGLFKCNGALVPVLIAVIALVTVLSVSSPSCGTFDFKTAYRSVTYIGMNMMLAAAVLTTVHGLSKKQIFVSAGVTSVIVGVLCCLLFGFRLVFGRRYGYADCYYVKRRRIVYVRAERSLRRRWNFYDDADRSYSPYRMAENVFGQPAVFRNGVGNVLPCS